MPVRANIKPLAWESEFFGVQSAILIFEDTAPELTPNLCAPWPRLQAKVAAQDTARLDALQQLGFKVVEGEADFTLALNSSCDSSPLRSASNGDIDLLRAIASTAFTTSRFRPPWYAAGDVGRFYGQWVENAVRGSFDDICLVAETKGSIDGFVTLRQLPDNTARIGLLAGRGLGALLMNSARQWCLDRQITTLHVATQLSNLAALRRYLLSGARLNGTAYWLYR